MGQGIEGIPGRKSPPQMTDVSVSIVNYNAREYLDRCLTSLYRNIMRHSFEVIVVDNSSNDGSTDLVRGKFPAAKLIVNSSNFGFIKANNIGIKNSRGRYVMCLNNDTEVLDSSIDKLIDFMDSNPDAGVSGPKLLNSDGTLQMQCRRGFPTLSNSLFYFSGLNRLFPRSKLFGGYLLTYLDDKNTVEVDSLCGAAMIVRREVIDKIGLMDESYYMYGDDIDWCYRIKKAGWKVYYLPDSEIVHYGGRGGSRRQSYRNIFEFHRAMAVFYRKHYAKKGLFILNWPVYAGIWLKCAVELAKNLFRKDKYAGTKKP
jgi:GT2 family glycosyltransferase